MNSEQLQFLPYTATSISVIGRFIFMFLLYKNKSTNSLSSRSCAILFLTKSLRPALLFCVLSISSSIMWLYYSIINNDTPMITRSSIEIFLLVISSIYIIKNKIQTLQSQQVLPV